MISAPSSTRSGPHPIVLWLLSSIGKKTIVALTGICLVLFVTGHLLGNFTVYLGPGWLNAYAEHLQGLGPLLWVIRIALLAIVGLHILFTMLLWKENQAARPKKYIASDPIQTSVSARTMRLSGLCVLAFIVFHLAHFTLGLVDPAYLHMKTMLDGQEVHDVYRMVVAGFSSVPVSLLYIGGLFLLTLHLSHGIGSLFQTLGLTNRSTRPVIEAVMRAYAWLLFIGYISIPISVLTGIVK